MRSTGQVKVMGQALFVQLIFYFETTAVYCGSNRVKADLDLYRASETIM